MICFFDKVWKNEWFGIFSSLPLGLPISLSFKKFHLIHHRAQGEAGVDPDLPTYWEGRNVTKVWHKLLFIFFQPLIYAARPLFTMPTKLRSLEIVAFFIQILFDFAVLHFLGGKALYIYFSVLYLALDFIHLQHTSFQNIMYGKARLKHILTMAH